MKPETETFGKLPYDEAGHGRRKASVGGSGVGIEERPKLVAAEIAKR